MTDTPRIVTPCPACGSRSLFVGSGGHLTCSVIGCKSPSVAYEIVRLQGDALAYREINQRVAEALEYAEQLMPDVWGRNVWHALLDDAQRLRRGMRQLLGVSEGSK